MTSVKISLNSTDLKNALTELEQLLKEAPELPPEVRQLALGFFDSAAKLCRIETASATGACLTLALKPSDGLLDLLSAIRTRDFQRLVIE